MLWTVEVAHLPLDLTIIHHGNCNFNYYRSSKRRHDYSNNIVNTSWNCAIKGNFFNFEITIEWVLPSIFVSRLVSLHLNWNILMTFFPPPHHPPISSILLNLVSFLKHDRLIKYVIAGLWNGVSIVHCLQRGRGTIHTPRHDPLAPSCPPFLILFITTFVSRSYRI